MRKIIGIVLSFVVFGLLIKPIFAVSPSTINLSTNNWRVFNINDSVAKLWDINRAQFLDITGIGFEFNSSSTGWFTVYLNTNYGDLSSKSIIRADTSWTLSPLYVNRALNNDGAYFRLYFQSAQGHYTSNDYWWNSGRLDLNEGKNGTLIGNLNDPTQWTNLCGQSAADQTAHPGPNCVGGIDPDVSPSDGFNYAKRNVKDVGLSFGRASRYASGVAISSLQEASFQLNSFKIE